MRGVMRTRLYLLAILFGVLLVPPLAGRDRGGSPLATPLPLDPDRFAVYASEVRDLLPTTYLGRTYNLPDPGEPVEVLETYLAMNRNDNEITSHRPGFERPAVVNASGNPAAVEIGVVKTAAQEGTASQLDLVLPERGERLHNSVGSHAAEDD
jgi:hypothetical protein